MKQILRNGCLFLLSALLITSLVPAPAYATFPGENGKITAFKYGRGVIHDGCDTSGEEFDRFTFNKDLSNPTKLIINNDPSVSPRWMSWTPDGKQFAFPTIDQWGLSIADASTNNYNGGFYTYPASDPHLAWSPDGITAALTTSGLYTMRPGDDYPSFVTWGPAGELYDMDNPKWSPQGDLIAFQKPTTGPPHYSQIGTMRPDGTNRQLFPVPSPQIYDFNPDWSPDGNKIVFASNRNQQTVYSPNDPAQIYIMNSDGTNIIQLTNTTYRYEEPIWSPDSTKILVTRMVPNTTQSISLVILDAQTGAELDTYTPSCNIGFNSVNWQPLGPTKVYRMANWKTKERLFTTNKNEALYVPDNYNGWILEGAAFTIPDEDTPGVTPIYRLANWKTKERLFTSSPAERDYALAHYEGWVSEGTSFHASPTSNTDLVPIYRLANWKTKERLFTSSAHERDYAVAHYDGWVSEGVAFYVPGN